MTPSYEEAREYTALKLNQHLETASDKLTHLSLPEKTALAEAISRIMPAGNVPSLLSAGLMRLPDRTASSVDHRRNLTLLMQGMQTFLDRAVYHTFFVGPAAVLSAYQMILKLAGKDLAKAFPEGTWQFYVEFGLREDSAWHTCETVGFQNVPEAARLNNADRLAAWVSAAGWLIANYDALLNADWIERTQLRHISDLFKLERLVEGWLKIRPYAAPDALSDYFLHRTNMFARYCQEVLEKAERGAIKRFEQYWNRPDLSEQRYQEQLAYRQQMGIAAALTPNEFNDIGMPIPPDQLKVGVIYKGRYYLIDIPAALSPQRVRVECAAILANKPIYKPATLDRALRRVRRKDQGKLRKSLSEGSQADLERLRTAPVLINWDMAENGPLSSIREGQRGIGDHCLTIFQTPSSTVFDLSHIFFDGPNGMAIAEILTGKAARMATLLVNAPAISGKAGLIPVNTVALQAPAGFAAQCKKYSLPPEVSAENHQVDIATLQRLRRALTQRNRALRLTVNDILLLYRAIYGPTYAPAPELMAALAELLNSKDAKVRNIGQAVQASLAALNVENPALLIPIDATGISPRERIFPTTVRNPFPDLLKRHKSVLEAVLDYQENGRGKTGFLGRNSAEQKAKTLRAEYFAVLQAYGEVMRQHRDISLQGGSPSTMTLKLMGGLPRNVQRMLENLPGRLDVINDVVRGQEVFSNVGQVSSSSSLRRFNTAKDDNDKKTLAWGVLTDAAGITHLSIRDFRPHVADLYAIDQHELARALVQDYLDGYVSGLNRFISELDQITRARLTGDATLT
jgi:hypothetical protein